MKLKDFFKRLLFNLHEDDMSSGDLKVGMFAFSNGKFSHLPHAYLELIGVVAWVNPNKKVPKGERGLIVALREEREIWSRTARDCEVYNQLDGEQNTKDLMRLAKKSNALFEAAQYCRTYKTFEVENWFLPAKYQLQAMLRYVDDVNTSLRQVEAPILEGVYWSSSEVNLFEAQVVDFSESEMENDFSGPEREQHISDKMLIHNVRPVLAF